MADPDQTVKNGSELIDRLLKGKTKVVTMRGIFSNSTEQYFINDRFFFKCDFFNSIFGFL